MSNNIIRGNMKNKFLFVLALLSVLTITGCKDKKDTAGSVLQAPQEVTVQSNGEQSLIIFDEVKNAEYYDIYINDVCVTVKSNGTGTIQFDASKIITLPQKYTIKVKAGGDKYFDSEFTEEYEYHHTSVLDAPIATIDGTILNWNKVENAEFYDVVVTSHNPAIETTYRFASNKFNFANILANKGEYLFKVQAISESSEYISSIYSNQVKYVHTFKLETPNNLCVAYSGEAGEYLLSFVSSEEVDSFTININGNNYSLPQSEMSTFLYDPNGLELDNIYTIKLETFAKSKGELLDCSTLTTISVKANTSNVYLESSEFSNTLQFQFISVLVTPRIEIEVNNTMCTIKIHSNNENSKYLSGFAIYLNDKKYKTISRDITELELPLSEIDGATIRAQAISNNSNCYSSNLSDGRHIGVKPLLEVEEINYENGLISWTAEEISPYYYVEILNSAYRYAQVVSTMYLDISTLCPCGEYWVRVTAIADGCAQSGALKNIIHTTQLTTPTQVNVSFGKNGTHLQFNEVEGAYGYVVYLNDTPIKRLFTGSPINLSQYINEANAYNVQVQAVGIINKGILASEKSEKQLIQSTRTLTAPTLTIIKEDDKYYLNVHVEESEKEIASGYEVWVNYQSIGTESFASGKIDITSYFTNAGQYNFMAKAKAIDSPYIKDSNMASLTYNCIKQLDTVTDIKVTKIEEESKYILTFKEQTLAAKYLVRIVKSEDENYNVEFELNQCVADISSHLTENGVYRVYVQALAMEGSFYTDSATSGNPYRLVKGETLATPQKIEVIKRENSDKINLTWNTVENCSGYQVYVYYNHMGQSLLRKSISVPQSLTPSVDIGSGEYLCLNKEGQYSIHIKALGDNELYENSQTAVHPYVYMMENVNDFIRNTIFMYGNTYSYKVTNIDELKNLLWYHYLYNQDVWQHNTLDYNLKIYCDVDLVELARKISDDLANEVIEIEDKGENEGNKDKYNKDKMNIISKALLAQYPEIITYTEGSSIQSFCLNPETNVYIFRYQDNLDDVKTDTIQTSNQVYKEKLEVVDAFEQRNSTYVFDIDNQQSIEVTTTEQLFMALQYNKKPNFVGDCEVAKAVYENARFILRQICSDDMSEYDKTLQIYNFLTKQITWNNVTTGSFDDVVSTSNSTSTLRGNLKDLYLEGILYNFESANGLYTSLNQIVGNTADGEGLSKAFVVLCSIEGIDAIKVMGQKTIGMDENQNPLIVDYSWNKVYLDIEEDGIEGKHWFVVDVTSGIKNTISIRKSGVTTKYQVALHKYFLMTDAEFKQVTNMQALSLHKRWGDTTDYIADTDFDYYTHQKYSCVYKSQELVKGATLTASQDTDIINAMIYASLKANKQHRVIMDIDAKEYMALKGESSTDSIISDINALYATASDKLGNEYNCNVTITIIDDRYIVMVLQSENYVG